MKKHYELKPLESGNYFTRKGWAYYDLKENDFFQGGESCTPIDWWSPDNVQDENDNESSTCFTMQHLDGFNKKDAQKWLKNDEMLGIIDESCHGIIGYVNQAHAERIYQILNKIKE